jgi:putative membrane protein
MTITFSSRACLPLALAVAALTVTGCASLPGMRTGMGAGAAAPAVVASTRLNAAEREFAIKAAAQGFYEVEVSRLASERAVNSGVRSYAQLMVNHHTQANNELVALMSAKGVAPPKGLAADKKTKLHKLAALPPSAAFDQGYVRVVGIEDHRTNIAVFERARRETKDRDLLAWIDRTLFTLRNHLAAAQSLAITLEG